MFKLYEGAKRNSLFAPTSGCAVAEASDELLEEVSATAYRMGVG